MLHPKRTLTERQGIVLDLYGKFRAQYARYFTPTENTHMGGAIYQMPPPRKAPSLKDVDLSNKKMSKIPLDDLQKSVLCGTCLSDASIRIQKHYKNARVQCRHSSRQSSWFFWKWTVCLKQFIENVESIQFQDPDGYPSPLPLLLSSRKSSEGRAEQKEKEVVLGKLKVHTKALPVLTQVHSIICTNNREKIERVWLNHMTDYFLMTVWLDDGSLIDNRQGVICLDSSPLDQQKVFVDYIKVVWGIESYCMNTHTKMKNGEIRYRIVIKDQDNLIKMLRIVAPLIPVKEMLYKILFVPFNNSDLLQRWASEVSQLVLPEFQDFVKEEYSVIITNYKKEISEDDIVHN